MRRHQCDGPFLMAAKRSKRTRLSSARVSDGVGPRGHLALVGCAERARLVVVLRGRSAATHVAAIREAAISATFLPCLIASFVVRARHAAGVVHLWHVQAHQRALTFQSFSPARARVES